MPTLEEDARIVHAYQEDEEVDAKVGDIIPEIRCTRMRESKFYKTLELYWHIRL
jgi:hypothetical protein